MGRLKRGNPTYIPKPTVIKEVNNTYFTSLNKIAKWWSFGQHWDSETGKLNGFKVTVIGEDGQNAVVFGYGPAEAIEAAIEFAALHTSKELYNRTKNE